MIDVSVIADRIRGESRAVESPKRAMNKTITIFQPASLGTRRSLRISTPGGAGLFVL